MRLFRLVFMQCFLANYVTVSRFHGVSPLSLSVSLSGCQFNSKFLYVFLLPPRLFFHLLLTLLPLRPGAPLGSSPLAPLEGISTLLSSSSPPSLPLPLLPRVCELCRFAPAAIPSRASPTPTPPAKKDKRG